MDQNQPDPKPARKKCDFCTVAVWGFFFMLGVIAGAVWAGVENNCLK